MAKSITKMNFWEKSVLKTDDGIVIGMKYNFGTRVFIMGSRKTHRSHIIRIFDNFLAEVEYVEIMYGNNYYRRKCKLDLVTYKDLERSLKKTMEVRIAEGKDMKGVMR